ERQVLTVRHRRTVDFERVERDAMTRPLIVIRGASIMRPDRVDAGRDFDHPFGDLRRGGQFTSLRGMIRTTQFQLQRLQHRLVVLMLVLRHHPIHIAIAQQRRSIEIDGLQALQHFFTHAFERSEYIASAREWERTTLTPWMLERIVQPRHLAELDGRVELLEQPQFLEARDMPEVPNNRTHEHIMLLLEIPI